MNHVDERKPERDGSQGHGQGEGKGEGDGTAVAAAALAMKASDGSGSVSGTSASKGKVSVNFALSKKKKKNVSTNLFQQTLLHDEQDDDIAAAAQLETEKRAKEGIQLVIPLLGARDESAPILQGLRDIIHSREQAQADDSVNEKKEHESKGDTENKDDTDVNANSAMDEDAIAEKALMDAASEHHEHKMNDTNGTNYSAKGSLIISSTRQDGGNNSNVHDRIQKLRGGSRNEAEKIDDTVKYQRDLAHRAENISVDSSAYVSVPIAEFGAAMLRGMGWKGSDESNHNSKGKTTTDTSTTTPRPHRLGLGATPLPPSMSGVSGSGKRHRARKGGTMADRAHLEKEEEAERQWRKHLEEKKKNDLQLTLQVGSIVRVVNNANANANANAKYNSERAKMVKVAGVPGLNRVLIRYENDTMNTSVKKGDIVLVERAELNERPFEDQKGSKNHREDDQGQSNYGVDSNSRRNEEDENELHDDRNSRKSPSRSCRDRKRKRRNEKSRSESRERGRATKHRRSHSRSRSRSRDRYKGERERGRDKDKDRRRDRHGKDRHRGSRHHRSRSRSRDKYEKRDRDLERDGDSERHRDRSRDREMRRDRDRERGNGRDIDRSDKYRSRDDGHERETDRRYSKTYHSHENNRKSDDNHWLISNIRVRVISKKIARGRQFKEKGVVVDVLRRGSEATLQMNNGELIERIHERYLETALPKVGGNVIILTGENKHEKGKLLERNSDTGQGIIQLFEDMHVKTLSLDDIAEYCGPLDDTLAADY